MLKIFIRGTFWFLDFNTAHPFVFVLIRCRFWMGAPALCITGCAEGQELCFADCALAAFYQLEIQATIK